MKGRFVAIPGAIFISIAAALWGTDALLRKPLAESTQAATIVFGEHLVLVLLTLPLIPAALVAVRRAGPRYVAAAVVIGVGASAIATILFTQAFVDGDPITPVVLQKVQPLVAVVGAWLYWKQKLERARWFLRTAIVAMTFPYIAATAGWVLTEMGRQPWIVQGLLKTADAHSPSVSSTMLGFSIAVFVSLYALLLVLDIWLMRRYAKLDPPELDRDDTGETPMPAIGY